MLWLLRAICVLLLLPFLTVAATPDRLPDAVGVASLAPSYATAESRSGSIVPRLTFTQVKRVTAEVEDGPEGEEAPSFHSIRANVGDDVAATAQSFVRIAFDCSHVIALADGAAPLRRFIPYAGFPTGPPAA